MDSMFSSGRKPQTSPVAWRAFLAAAALIALCVALASTSAAAPVARSSSGAQPEAVASKVAKCTAMIQKGKKLVAVRESVYKYKFVKVKGSKRFQRKIVKVRQKM